MSDPASHTAGDHDRTGALSQRNVTGKCTKTQTEAVECGAGVGHIGHRDCRWRDTSHCLRACRRYHEPDGGPARSGDLLCDHRILRPLRRTAAAKGRLSSDSRSGSSLGLARTEAVAGDGPSRSMLILSASKKCHWVAVTKYQPVFRLGSAHHNRTRPERMRMLQRCAIFTRFIRNSCFCA